MLESLLTCEQRQLAINFLIDVCAMTEVEACQREREVELDNVWSADDDSVGYYELNADVCVTNADKFCSGLQC